MHIWGYLESSKEHLSFIIWFNQTFYREYINNPWPTSSRGPRKQYHVLYLDCLDLAYIMFCSFIGMPCTCYPYSVDLQCIVLDRLIDVDVLKYLGHDWIQMGFNTQLPKSLV